MWHVACAGRWLISLCCLHTRLHSKGLPPLPKSYWNVLCPVARVRRRVVLQVAGLDGYMYLRTLQLCLVSCLCLCAFGLAVVLPVNLTGSVASDALVQASIGNVTRDTLWLHVPIVYCVFIWAMVLIHRLYKEVRPQGCGAGFSQPFTHVPLVVSASTHTSDIDICPNSGQRS